MYMAGLYMRKDIRICVCGGGGDLVGVLGMHVFMDIATVASYFNFKVTHLGIQHLYDTEVMQDVFPTLYSEYSLIRRNSFSKNMADYRVWWINWIIIGTCTLYWY